jgi:hypothetical protein
MWTLVLISLLVEFIYLLIVYFKDRIKLNFIEFLKYIIFHLSITDVINKKAKKIDLLCIIIVYSLYLCNNAFIKPNISGLFASFFTGHFNDSIATIMLLAYCNISYAAKAPEKRVDNLYKLIIICFIWGVLWENFAPIFNPIAVKDPLDVLCYCFGGIIYYVIIFLEKKYSNKNSVLLAAPLNQM